MSTQCFRIATRKSPLALWQAHFVKKMLEEIHPQIQIEVLTFVTEGDRLLSEKLADFGGKGLFVKEIERALINEEADIAVHSMKDMPANLPDELVLGAICKREDPRDVLVSNRFSLETLPHQARIGTSSLRRQCQIQRMDASFTMLDLRGNVDSRLAKLDEGQFDAIILAAAGLKRLGLYHRMNQFLDSEIFIPAVGQGAIGIECRRKDTTVSKLIAPLNHNITEACVLAERAVNARLGGGCHAPIAAHAILENDIFVIRGMVGCIATLEYIEAKVVGKNPEQVGSALAERLIKLGADNLLKGITAC